jgi:alpha-glucosidase
LSESGVIYNIVFRCYNDGFAYRFVFPEQEGMKMIQINKELTRLNFTGNFRYWAYNGENHNLGPLSRKEQDMERVQPPMVIETEGKVYLSIQEAGIIRYAPFDLAAAGNDYSVGINLLPTADSLPVKTSWRSFIAGGEPGDLVGSDLLVNLNEPCKIEDPSWIKPGKSLWDWRVWGYVAEDGFEYGMNTITHKRMIDFASKNNIQYLLMDADWYGPEFSEESDPTSGREGVNIEDCMTYANEKNVGIILYLNDVGAKEFGLERILKQFSDWGAVGVKYGFMRDRDMEQKVRYTREVVEMCARYRLMVDFHDGPIPPSGDRRTWPNLVTKEYCHAQADAKRSYFPETAVNTAFINMIAGPLDATNGWFDLNNAHSRVKVFEVLPGTVAAEVAKLIVMYTGWMVLPDSPEEYLKKDDLFDCIRNMPPQFDGFRVLDGKIDEYISVVRRAGGDWYVGSLTNREARSVTIDFSFLPENKKYRARLYEDAAGSHFLENKESYNIREMIVDSDTRIEIDMAAGGGHAIHLSPDMNASAGP